MRKAEITRKTDETDISLLMHLDGDGKSEINTGIGFMDHMLTLFSKHGKMNMILNCKGDLEVDFHHTVEDIGIVIGKALGKCLEDKKGIRRYASDFVPMDETLVQASIDISGRAYLVFNADFPKDKVGDMDTELFEEFFRALVNHAKITLHVNLMYGKNTHHIIEAIFKCIGRIIKEASQIEGNEILSTKGLID
ncbi:MAG: imidazoleglycerol-phosphate dehydratase HisB [Clostridiales bacterium]|nr:imidazoleglycerol-phosphate dehydratase HisB [Clostridiales bacterium]